MASSYGFDISGPARDAREAVQWLYLAYLGAVKEQNGAAMSLGRASTFLDIYFESDLAAGTITEQEAQEIIDDFVIKLRIVRFSRTPEYDELFAGDPMWTTESTAGVGDDGRPLLTKTSFRSLQTLCNLAPAPEPNLTIWYSPRLPDGFRDFATRVVIETSSIQFESDEIMRCALGDDGAIACCVSPMLHPIDSHDHFKRGLRTPDGRRRGEPFAPGANPMHGRRTENQPRPLTSSSVFAPPTLFSQIRRLKRKGVHTYGLRGQKDL